MAHPRRFERPTPAVGGQCSIQLSYGCILCLRCRLLNYTFLRKNATFLQTASFSVFGLVKPFLHLSLVFPFCHAPFCGSHLPTITHVSSYLLLRHSESESCAISSFATGTYSFFYQPRLRVSETQKRASLKNPSKLLLSAMLKGFSMNP